MKNLENISYKNRYLVGRISPYVLLTLSTLTCLFLAVWIFQKTTAGGVHCADGWPSLSIGHQGACSWHGGVVHPHYFLGALAGAAAGAIGLFLGFLSGLALLYPLLILEIAFRNTIRWLNEPVWKE